MTGSGLTELVQRQLEMASLSGEVDAVMHAIAEHACAALGGDGAAVTVQRDDRLVFVAATGASGDLAGASIPLDGSLGGRCLLDGTTLVVDDVAAAESAQAARTVGSRDGSLVLAPLVRGERALGVLSVYASRPHAFAQEAAGAISLLAQSASIALRNAELVARLTSAERASRALVEQSADAVLVLDGDLAVLAANEAAAALLWRPREELVGAEYATLVDPSELAERPLRREDFLRRREVREERAFLRKDGAVVTVETAVRLLDDGRLHATLRDVSQRRRNDARLRESLDRLRGIVDLQREISELELPPDETADAILERVQKLVRADGAAVVWVEPDGLHWRHGCGTAAQHVGLRQGDGQSLAALAVATGRTHYAPDTAVDPRVDAALALAGGVRSLVCAPLRRRDTVIGVLSVAARAPHAFDELAVETARMMAEYVGTALRSAEERETRLRSVRALAESEHRFRGAFEGAGAGMAFTNLDGSFARVNDSFARMLGYTTEELLQLDVESITHPDDRARYRSDTSDFAIGRKDRVQAQKRFVRKDGSTLHAQIAVVLLRDADGRPVHRITQILDMTELKEAQSLRLSTFERSVVPMAILDDDRRFADANEAAGVLLSTSRERLLDQRLDDLVGPDAAAALWEELREHGVAEAPATVEREDGERRLIELTATANAQPGRHIVVARDVTRQKDLELQLRQAQKMEAVGRLAGGIAHDFNNLLTAISGYSQFLASSLEDERLRRHAEEIRRAAERAAALTGQLLAFSRRQVLQPRVLDLNEVVVDMEMMLKRLIGEDVELVTELEPELGAVRADPTQIEQVIVNLIVNARDAMPGGGSAIVRTRTVGEDVELSITDTGIGMTRQERQHLFDPFFTTKAGGTGLGLATVYGIVEQSGGTIEVDSEPGLGSCFRVRLPRVAHAAEHLPARAAAEPHVGSETILLVEDERVVRQLVAEILETSGYTVLQATDGPSALELLRRHNDPVHLLVTDVVMPGMSGPDVAKAVTAMRPGTQVLFTSGYTDQAIDHHGVLEPGIAFLQKPFSAEDLTRKVRSLVEEQATAVG